MNKVTMPEPLCHRKEEYEDGVLVDVEYNGSDSFSGGRTGGIPLVPVAQAEAYKDACVREALEKAVGILDRMYVNALKAKVPTAEDDEAWNLVCTAQARALTEARLEVKSLIPKQ